MRIFGLKPNNVKLALLRFITSCHAALISSTMRCVRLALVRLAPHLRLILGFCNVNVALLRKADAHADIRYVHLRRLGLPRLALNLRFDLFFINLRNLPPRRAVLRCVLRCALPRVFLNCHDATLVHQYHQVAALVRPALQRLARCSCNVRFGAVRQVHAGLRCATWADTAGNRWPAAFLVPCAVSFRIPLLLSY
jgi:hypothetical protein